MAITPSMKLAAWFALAVLCLGGPASAQSNKNEQPTAGSDKISTNLPAVYQRWLSEDVRWIISPEEQAAFLRLSRDEARDRFIEQFWLRRDPTPGTARNEYKEEHYRRIAYANVHFEHAVPGWETDRGRIYILYGRPEEVRSQSPRGGSDSVRPAELWHYDLGNGKEIDLKFVDICGCGDYRLEELRKN